MPHLTHMTSHSNGNSQLCHRVHRCVLHVSFIGVVSPRFEYCSDGDGTHTPVEGYTVSCPDHLVCAGGTFITISGMCMCICVSVCVSVCLCVCVSALFEKVAPCQPRRRVSMFCPEQ